MTLDIVFQCFFLKKTACISLESAEFFQLNEGLIRGFINDSISIQLNERQGAPLS